MYQLVLNIQTAQETTFNYRIITSLKINCGDYENMLSGKMNCRAHDLQFLIFMIVNML